MRRILALEQNTRYTLAAGTQVREEDFGLLFYTKIGPRLYFLSSGELLDKDFFSGEFTLDKWTDKKAFDGSGLDSRLTHLQKGLNHLKEKGVILGC